MTDGAAATAARFLGRVGDYARARPGYPLAIRDFLVAEGALFPGAAVADVGAGTGLSTGLLLDGGYEVVAVEPNAEMRAAADERFASDPRYRSLAGSAEATGLPDRSVDLVIAAQAFHWFDPAAARAEWRRILREPKRAALIWNSRRSSGTPFLERYERLLVDFGTDYAQVGHRGVGVERLTAFFCAPYATFSTPNSQTLDRAGVRSRLLSSSYIPAAGTPRHAELLAELDRLIDETSTGDAVEIVYDCEVFLGSLP